MSLHQNCQLQVELRTFIRENFLFGQEGSAVEDDESLVERGIIDSTGVLELTSFLEHQYGISVSDEELVPENLDSITSLIRFIRSKQAQAA
jgi:acyl carrier protein